MLASCCNFNMSVAKCNANKFFCSDSNVVHFNHVCWPFLHTMKILHTKPYRTESSIFTFRSTQAKCMRQPIRASNTSSVHADHHEPALIRRRLLTSNIKIVDNLEILHSYINLLEKLYHIDILYLLTF